MTNKDEALKMVHKTFMQLNERTPRKEDGSGYFDKEINACKEALEQPKLTDEKGRPMTYWGGLEQPAQEPVAHIKQGMDGYPKLVFNGTFQYDSIAAKQPDIALYIKEQL